MRIPYCDVTPELALAAADRRAGRRRRPTERRRNKKLAGGAADRNDPGGQKRQQEFEVVADLDRDAAGIVDGIDRPGGDDRVDAIRVDAQQVQPAAE